MTKVVLEMNPRSAQIVQGLRIVRNGRPGPAMEMLVEEWNHPFGFRVLSLTPVQKVKR